MKSSLRFIRERYRNVYIAFLFMVATLAVVLIVPTEGKFRYELQKGRPWKHESLMAPYDFPIYKSEKQYKREQDSVLKTCGLYYQRNPKVYEYQMDILEKSYASRWERQVMKYDSVFTITEKKKSLNRIEFDQQAYDKYWKSTKKAFGTIYKTGIVELPDVFYDIYDNKDISDITINVFKDQNIAEERYYDEYFTEKSAYEYLMEYFNNLNPENVNSKKNVDIDFIKGLELEDFLVADLLYDTLATDRNKKSLLGDISHTRGMVQKGQLIILHGDVVTNDKYLILESLKREYETYLSDSSNFYILLSGQLIIIICSMIVLFMFLYNFRLEILKSSSQTLFVLLVFTITILLTAITTNNDVVSIYFIPFAIQPILLRTFFDSRIAIFQHIITILLTGFIAPNSFEFVFIQIIVGVITVMSISNLHSRAQLFASAFYAFLTYSLIYFGLAMMRETEIAEIGWETFGWFAANSLLILFVYPAIYLFERAFGFVSEVTLIELSNTNRPLLRRLAEQAPGTFQHSMQMANIAEAAVRRINGNTLLIRAGALYHDIGKMLTSNFFIENQGGGPNPHDQLEYDKSAEIIINHVNRGVDLARKYKLPEVIIDFIRTHHGRSKVKYFYISHKNKYPDAEVDVEKFTYPGPLPFSKETAVLMMADAVEAASRTLKSINEKTLENLINNIIDNQISDAQFNYANITFNDISLIKDEMKKKLMNIYHSRIEYPIQNKK